MGKPGPKAYSVINDLLKKAKGKSPLKQQKLPAENSGLKRNMYKSY
tara:strand:- start:711 stop:848 length:138 start_codon:yes stop_codon:yes gene_type:complete